MREELKAVCTEFIKDRDIVKEAFAWDSSYLQPVCASILGEKEKTLTAQDLKQYKQMIKDKTGVFSDFRGYGMTPMACMLAVSGNAEGLLNNALAVYDVLKRDYWSSHYLPMVAMIVAQMAEPSEYNHIVDKAGEIYKLMKEEHPFLTSGEDGPFAAMLAFSDRSAKAMNEEVEKCYQLLKPKFFSGNAVQSLSHVLALGEGSAESKCQKLENLFDTLKASGYKYGTDYELATLGALSILDCDVKTMAAELIEVTDYLGTQKGYGGLLGFTKRQRLQHAAMIISSTYVEKKMDIMNPAAVSGTIAMIAAQQAAMCAAIAAAVAASNAAN